MNLVRYKKLSQYEITKRLDKLLVLTDYQKSKLMYVDEYPFKAYEFESPKKVKPIWRLSILLYWIFCLLIIVCVHPVAWLLWGSKYLNEKNMIYKLWVAWSKKLNFY